MLPACQSSVSPSVRPSVSQSVSPSVSLPVRVSVHSSRHSAVVIVAIIVIVEYILKHPCPSEEGRGKKRQRKRFVHCACVSTAQKKSTPSSVLFTVHCPVDGQSRRPLFSFAGLWAVFWCPVLSPSFVTGDDDGCSSDEPTQERSAVVVGCHVMSVVCLFLLLACGDHPWPCLSSTRLRYRSRSRPRLSSSKARTKATNNRPPQKGQKVTFLVSVPSPFLFLPFPSLPSLPLCSLTPLLFFFFFFFPLLPSSSSSSPLRSSFLSSSHPPRSLMTSANPLDRVSPNPTTPNTTLSSTENSAFFAEPDFSKSKLPASPTLETAMLDIKTSLPKESDSPMKSAAEDPTEAKMASSSAPLSPVAGSATSPLLTPAVQMSIETTIMDDSHDTDIQVTEAMEGQIQQEMETAASTAMDTEYLILDAPTENGTSSIQFLPKSIEQQLEESEQNNQILRSSLDKVLQDKEEVVRDKDRVDRDLYHTTVAYHELNGRYAELQQKLANRERDYEIMSKNYLEHVRTIRPTDDDHGTIMDKLTQLKASIEHLIRKTQGSRSVNLKKDAAIEYLKGAGLLENFPIEEDRLEPYHLNLFMESVVMSTLINAFFGKHLSCVFEHNTSFKDIYEWMVARDDKLAIRWRQHLCVLLAKDPKARALQDEVVEKTAKTLADDLAKVYTNANELAKSKDICAKAFELSRAMSGLENVVYPQTVELGTQFDEETMAPSLKSNPDGKVALVVFPAFKDNQDAFDVRPKVWCY